MLEWLKAQINEAWENRERIVPKYEGAGKAHPLTIFKMLPRTNCRAFGVLTVWPLPLLMRGKVKAAGLPG